MTFFLFMSKTTYKLLNSRFAQSPQHSHLLENLEGSIFLWLVVWLVVLHTEDILVDEDAQVVPPEWNDG